MTSQMRVRYEEDRVAGTGRSIGCIEPNCTLAITHHGPHDVQDALQPPLFAGFTAVAAIATSTIAVGSTKFDGLTLVHSPGQLPLDMQLDEQQILQQNSDRLLEQAIPAVASLDARRARVRGLPW